MMKEKEDIEKKKCEKTQFKFMFFREFFFFRYSMTSLQRFVADALDGVV